MDRKNAWIIAGSVVAGFLVLGLTLVFAQRFPSEEREKAGVVGRYQAVRVTADAVLLLDTVTGDLYTAVPRDIKPYDSRPRGGADRHGWKDAKDLPKPTDDLKKDFNPFGKDKPVDKFKDAKDSFRDGFNKDARPSDKKPSDRKDADK
jgi:hypothetical protein